MSRSIFNIFLKFIIILMVFSFLLIYIMPLDIAYAQEPNIEYLDTFMLPKEKGIVTFQKEKEVASWALGDKIYIAALDPNVVPYLSSVRYLEADLFVSGLYKYVTLRCNILYDDLIVGANIPDSNVYAFAQPTGLSDVRYPYVLNYDTSYAYNGVYIECYLGSMSFDFGNFSISKQKAFGFIDKLDFCMPSTEQIANGSLKYLNNYGLPKISFYDASRNKLSEIDSAPIVFDTNSSNFSTVLNYDDNVYNPSSTMEYTIDYTRGETIMPIVYDSQGTNVMRTAKVNGLGIIDDSVVFSFPNGWTLDSIPKRLMLSVQDVINIDGFEKGSPIIINNTNITDMGSFSDTFSLLGEAFSGVADILAIEVFNIPLGYLLFLPLFFSIILFVIKLIRG